jgi:hypothetical protein
MGNGLADLSVEALGDFSQGGLDLVQSLLLVFAHLFITSFDHPT